MNIDVFSAMEELGFYQVKVTDLYQVLAWMRYPQHIASEAIDDALEEELLWVDKNGNLITVIRGGR